MKELITFDAGRRSSAQLDKLYKNHHVRKLIKPELARLLTLEDMLEALTGGGKVTNKELRKHLLDDEYDNYMSDCEIVKEQDRMAKDKPDEVREYEQLLKKAIFIYNRADYYSSRGRHQTAQKLFNKADGYFERLYEYFDEIITSDQSLTMWFDRTITLDAENAPSLTPECAPRVVTSTSIYNQSSPSFLMVGTRNDCKITAVEHAIYALKYERKEVSSDTKAHKKLNLNMIRQISAGCW